MNVLFVVLLSHFDDFMTAVLSLVLADLWMIFPWNLDPRWRFYYFLLFFDIFIFAILFPPDQKLLGQI